MTDDFLSYKNNLYVDGIIIYNYTLLYIIIHITELTICNCIYTSIIYLIHN